ncbi:hypothetical protein F7725_002212 [Dissostichus mawsoni]|uniref:Fibronectin type-III domain-containing protein n=1 Tax=Dissostichus mawsoni TaxID=36200 RepID=A0A7J5Y2U5_DISMA|nr:hypothetical protein F7725_002212 [Dissostichus mawsoni]
MVQGSQETVQRAALVLRPPAQRSSPATPETRNQTHNNSTYNTAKMRMGMQQHSHSFLVLLLMVFIAGIVLSVPSTPRRSRVRRQNMKVRINASGDTIVMKFLRPNADTKLEGYILGYGSSMFSKQFIQLPENGQPYETEFDAEPKYLIAVQPIPTNDVKKHCKGKVELQKPLHLVIGTVTPTSVLLSWGTLLKTPYEGNVMNDCLEEGHYTVRYRERHRKWNYQTCPTSDTVIDNLKPNAVYEFAVQPNTKDVTGVWSKPVIHNISSGGTEEKARKITVKRPINPVKPLLPGPRFSFPQRHVHPNRTQGRPPITRKINSKTTLGNNFSDLNLSLKNIKLQLSHRSTNVNYISQLPPQLLKRNLCRPLDPHCLLSPKSQSNIKYFEIIFYSTVLWLHGHIFFFLQNLGGRDLSRSVLPPFMESPLPPKPRPPPHITAIVEAVKALQKNINKHVEHNSQQPQQRPQSQPHAQSPPKPQLRPQYQPQPKPYPQTQIPQLKPWPKIQTQPQSESWPKQHPQSQPQTTPHLQVEPQPKPTEQPKHQSQPQTQPQKKSQTQPQVLTLPQPTPVAHPQPQTQPVLKTNPELQLTTKQQTEAKPTTKPKTIFLQSNPKSQTRPKGQPKPQPSPKIKIKIKKPEKKPEKKPRTGNRQEPPRETRPRSQAQLPKKIQAQPKPSPPKPQPQPQPGIHFQTRTYSDPTKVTPRQAVSTAPSPPEEGKPLPRPALATEKAGSYNQGKRRVKFVPLPSLLSSSHVKRSSCCKWIIPNLPNCFSAHLGTGVLKPSIAAVPRSPISSTVPQAGRNTTRTRVPPQTPRISGRPFTPSKTSSSHSSSTPGATGGAHHRGIAYPKHVVWPKEKTVPTVLRPIPFNKKPNLVGKPSDNDKPMDLKQGGKESILKPFPLVTAKPKQERRQQHTTSSAPALNTSRFDMNDNSSVFSHSPVSDVDIMGKPRFVGPHVIYKTDKKPDEPCSITSSLSFFADEEGGDQNVTAPPRVPPSNLTVVTVEGCPSFVILDWQKTDNETREYEVVSTTKGPNGEEVSVLTTNQTHTAVRISNQRAVTPKNELGAGPSSKDAIWTQFPFKSDDYSECNGKQYVKRTWYRKFVGIQLCNSLRYKLYMSDSLTGKFYNIGDQTGHGEDHCQFVDSFLDGRTGTQMFADQLPSRQGFYRAMRQEPVHFGEIGGKSHVTYVGWYECGTPIPGKW